jgi:hypothetical protein
MYELDANALAMLELVADHPLTIVPPLHMPMVEQLSRSGLLVKSGSLWFASAAGLRTVGRTLH